MKLCMAGIDHVSAALEQREKLSLVRGQVQAVLLRIAERTGCAARDMQPHRAVPARRGGARAA